MKKLFCFLLVTVSYHVSGQGQTKSSSKDGMRTAAVRFLQSLSPSQKEKTCFAFDDEERYHWNFVPLARKGIMLKELSVSQQNLAMALLKTALSDTGFQKAQAIIGLESILKAVENRPADDSYRDPGKYYVSIFGEPASNNIWGWRLEGHHVAFNFSSDEKGLVSGTPGFLGANPAVVLSGNEKGKEILKDETRLGFALLHALTDAQKQKAIISTKAPSEIITGASRKAMIETPEGISYNELNDAQQKQMMELINLYVYRSTKLFARQMIKDIEQAGLSNLRFAWAGAEQPGLGNPHYYRIQGPTLIIEYDNTQNNANHVHSVTRDLKNDFGGDQLLEHYRQTAH
jgi:hypothetical protein